MFAALRLSVGLLVLSGVSGTAWGFGALVADGVSLDAGRVLLVREGDRARMVAQASIQGAADKVVWLLPIPNFDNLDEAALAAEPFPMAAFQELEGLSAPSFEGMCDGAPNQQSATETQGDYGANTAFERVNYFNFQAIQDGDLAAFLEREGLTVDDALAQTIAATADQNFMFAAVTVAGADAPIVSLSWPIEAGDTLEIMLRPTSNSVAAGNADVVYYVLDGARQRFNLTTTDLDPSSVAFVSAGETNYSAALDAALAPAQTQGFVTEWAGDVTGDAALSAAELTAAVNGSGGYLTRLRMRMSPAAMRANQKVSLREGSAAALGGPFSVEGFRCAGDMPPPDAGAGPAPDAGAGPGPGDDPEPPQTDGGPVNAAADGGTGGGGGSSSGCSVSRPRGDLPLVFLLALLPLALIRRARRS